LVFLKVLIDLHVPKTVNHLITLTFGIDAVYLTLLLSIYTIQLCNQAPLCQAHVYHRYDWIDGHILWKRGPKG